MDELTILEFELGRLVIELSQYNTDIRMLKLQFKLDVDFEEVCIGIEEDTISKAYHAIEYARYGDEKSENINQVDFSKLAIRQHKLNIITLDNQFAIDIAGLQISISELEAYIDINKNELRIFT